jgi:hypothetical protein
MMEPDAPPPTTDANTNPGKDTINFNIAATDVAGRTIIVNEPSIFRRACGN